MTLTKNQKKRLRAKQSQITGNGDYKQVLKAVKSLALKQDKMVSNLGGKVGGAIGKKLGNKKLGSQLGRGAADLLIGRGDYTLVSNSLMTGSNHVPLFSADGKRGIRIIEKEYVGDVYSGELVPGSASTSFKSEVYDVNPANTKLFPWLSKMANLFDQWEPNGIVCQFVSTSSEFNGANQALGAVIMATDYDITDPVYNSKQEMENAAYACSTKPANNLQHGLECDPKERPTRLLYTRSNRNEDGRVSQSLADLGKFQIATQGVSQANINLGELWITYDITFYKKQVLTDEEGVQNRFVEWRVAPVDVDVDKGWLKPFIEMEPSEGNITDITVTSTDDSNVWINFGPNNTRGRFQMFLSYETDADYDHEVVFLESDSGTDGLTIVQNPTWDLKAGTGRYWQMTAVVDLTKGNQRVKCGLTPSNMTGPAMKFLIQQVNPEADYEPDS
jgi:hypothetical protein